MRKLRVSLVVKGDTFNIVTHKLEQYDLLNRDRQYVLHENYLVVTLEVEKWEMKKITDWFVSDIHSERYPAGSLLFYQEVI